MIAMVLVMACPRSETQGPPDVVPESDASTARCPPDGGPLDLATLRALGLEPALSLPAKSTAQVTIAANLDVRATVPSTAFDATAADLSANFPTVFLVYDSLSAQHQVTVWYVKTDPLRWDWHALALGDEWASGRNDPVEAASGTLGFNIDGALVEQVTNSSVFLFSGALPQEIRFDFTGSTGYGDLFVTHSVEQDGYPAGNASEVHAEGGALIATYGNGQTRPIGSCP